MPASPALIAQLVQSSALGAAPTSEKSAAEGFSALLAVGGGQELPQAKTLKPNLRLLDDSRAVALGAPDTFYATNTPEPARDIAPKPELAEELPAPKETQEAAPRVRKETPAADDNVTPKQLESADDTPKLAAETKPVATTEPQTTEAPETIKIETAETSEVTISMAQNSTPFANLLQQLQALIFQLQAQLKQAMQAQNPQMFAQGACGFCVEVKTTLVAWQQVTVGLSETTALTLSQAKTPELAEPTTLDMSALESWLGEFSELSAMPKQISESASPNSVLARMMNMLRRHLQVMEQQLPKLAEPNLPAAQTAQATIVTSAEQTVSSLTQAAVELPAPAKEKEAEFAPSVNPVIAEAKEAKTAAPNVTAAPAQTATAPIAAARGSADTGGQQTSGQNSQQAPNAAPVSSALSASVRSHDTTFAKLVSGQAQTPVAEQVAFHIKTALKDGSSKINIQLDPAKLGKLEIKLHIAGDGRTHVAITAENKDTLSMLQRDTSGLERALADAGLRADSGSLSFNLRGGEGGRDQDHSQASSNYLKALPEEEPVLPTDVIARSYLVNLAEGLDIRI